MANRSPPQTPAGSAHFKYAEDSFIISPKTALNQSLLSQAGEDGAYPSMASLANCNIDPESCGDFDVTRLEDGFGVLHPRSQEEEEEDAKAENTSSCIRGVLSSTLLVLVALGLIVLGQQYLGDLLTWFQRSQGFEAKLLYGCLFIPIGFPVFLCGSVLLSMGAGFIYGAVQGFFITMTGTLIGGILALLSLRYFFKDYAKKLISSYPRLKKIVQIIGGPDGSKMVAMIRLSPIPLGLQNAVFATTDVKIGPFLMASMFGIMPHQLLNCYMGSSLRNIDDVLAGKSENSLMLYAQVLVIVGITIYINSRIKREMDKQCEEDAVPLTVPLPQAHMRSTSRESIARVGRPGGTGTQRGQHRRCTSDGAITYFDPDSFSDVSIS